MQSTQYDAIVVGSGISVGWAAKELAEKGLCVLLLERGRNVEHVKDYVNATKGAWEYAHRGGRTQSMEELYPVLKRDYPLNEKNLAFWASDGEALISDEAHAASHMQLAGLTRRELELKGKSKRSTRE